MQIDVGFGDPLVPGPSLVRLPTILDFPSPELQGYSRESAIAEKLQIMVYLGEINSRMKDFYDVWALTTHFDFDGSILAQAIRETFRWRQTALSPSPVALYVKLAYRIKHLSQRMKSRYVPTAIVPADKELYQRQITATDRRIAALGYEWYGWTTERTTIVIETSSRAKGQELCQNITIAARETLV